jgi:hypothetical protein
MQKYGYKDVNNRLTLKITLTTKQFTPQGLKLESDVNNGTLSIVDVTGYKPWIWTTSDIRLELHNLCIVYADSRKEGLQEYFKLEKAVLATGLDERCFRLVDEGLVKIDLRMHLKTSGTSRNHGTAFRISKWEDIVECYKFQSSLLKSIRFPEMQYEFHCCS